jgi:glycosyltransferase involved in cell wall biosynthesis
MGYPEDKYVDLAHNAGVSSFITFTGKIDYAIAPEYLCLGDLAVSPKLSCTEANGKLYNYMACGLPTVAFESPVNREILGNLGVYAEFGNASDLARQMISLAFDDKRRLELSRMVRQRSVVAYSWNRIADEITQVYERMLTPEAQSHEH